MAQVFISHSSHDRPLIAEPLYHALSAHGHEVWYDQVSVDYTDSIPLEISAGLQTASVFVVVVSSHYNKSAWCLEELGAIIANRIGTDKRLLVVVIDNAPVPPLIAHIRHVTASTAELASEQARDKLLHFIVDLLPTIEADPEPARRVVSAASLVDLVLTAEANRSFGQHLLETTVPSTGRFDPGRAEGLILIKPGGTFFQPCLTELFRRILDRCDVVQIRLFDGEMVRRRNLFRQQYVSSTKLAAGEIGLNEEDYRNIRRVYDTDEFAQHFGVKYSDDIVTPALRLEDVPYRLSPEEISSAWDRGRAEDLFWNGRWNGLNKIDYQKSVFPIVVDQGKTPMVRLVLNGFIPGYKRLFEAESARTVAIHVQTWLPWQDVRELLVGGASNPGSCIEGSIRRDASEGRIPLDPRDPIVNGQRNVCHSSATLVDGMRELAAWFEYRTAQTMLGSVLGLVGQSERDIEETIAQFLEDLSWTTRNDTFAELLYEFRQRQVFDRLKGAHSYREEAVQQFAAETGADAALVRRSESAHAWVENGVRWMVSGQEYFLFTIAKVLFQDAQLRGVFYEAAHEIIELHRMRYGRDRQNVLADAIRIAANDLKLLGSPVYRQRLGDGQLFRAEVMAELPQEALGCAERTRRNLVTDLVTLVDPAPSEGRAARIGDTQEWEEFERSSGQNRAWRIEGPVGLILAGGRSTRMYSTIPKPVLPFGSGLLFDAVVEPLGKALGTSSSIVAAAGFRARLVQRALGSSVNGRRVDFLTYPKTLGLAFRVATALHELAAAGGDGQLIVLTYTDMPYMSADTIRALIERVGDRDAFGMLICLGVDLSGYIEERQGRIRRVIQRRLRPDLCRISMPRDVGVYVFRNTVHMRQSVLSISNDNVRHEYVFADVVEILAESGREIVGYREDDEAHVHSVNTVPELLLAEAARFIRRGDMTGLRHAFVQRAGLTLPTPLPADVFRAMATNHHGPLYFFPWWESMWLSKQ